MKVVLVGQPNSGKSTVFNWVVGYKSATANFPGTTVEYAVGKTRLNGDTVEVIDLPGTYSLSSSDAAEKAAVDYLLHEEADVIINVVDASVLDRSLELTLQLLEFERPVVLCLNMMDEAQRKGIRIDVDALSSLLRVPVVQTVASKGLGVPRLFAAARKAASEPKVPAPRRCPKPIETAIAAITTQMNGKLETEEPVRHRLLAIKLLEGDPEFVEIVKSRLPALLETVRRQQHRLEDAYGRPADEVIASERHAVAHEIFEQVAVVGRPTIGLRDKIDDLLMHNLWGYIFLLIFFIAFFNFIFKFGAFLEPRIVARFENWIEVLGQFIGAHTLLFGLTSGVLQGLAGGFGIVLPYLVPFLLGLAILEDVGYLPRVAFLLDTFMHRIGLHGTSILPLILGYGCSVPAVMATRILRQPRDRLIASVLAVLVPCSARTTVIFGLVAFYIGPNAALAIYVLNIVVVALAGRVLTLVWPEVTPGMILEVPPYRVPSTRVVLLKTWWRIKDFVIVAWPLLIGGSLVLSIAEYAGVDQWVNLALRPVTAVLGLPAVVGTTLLFGILRKELSMLMLIQALGTTEITAVMQPSQILVFTIFVLFYIPCVATMAILWRELGRRQALFVLGFTSMLAAGIALISRGVLELVGFH